jgi:transposase InsO family protein
VKELAGDGVPVTVTCRVLKLARQPYYRWLERPVTRVEFAQAARTNALFDAHREARSSTTASWPNEARGVGAGMADRTAWRICRDNSWWSLFGKKRGRIKKAGPPVHDDLVRRDFTAAGPNRLWLTDITEHATTWIPAVVATVGTTRRSVKQ